MEQAAQLYGSTVAHSRRVTVTDFSDAGVVKQVLGGDRDAFRLLVQRYERQVFTLCLRMVRNRHDAEDCAQTAFVKAYSALASFRPGSSFKSWLYRIASNACIDSLRKSSKTRHTVSTDDDESGIDLHEPGRDPRSDASLSELQEVMAQALHSLDDKYRLPLTLFHLEGLECTEISAMLKLHTGTVKTRIRRGRLMLREVIAREWPELAAMEVGVQ